MVSDVRRPPQPADDDRRPRRPLLSREGVTAMIPTTPCPWAPTCTSTAGYRSLTTAEDLRHTPIAVAHTFVSGLYNLRHPKVYLDALMTPTRDLRCVGCGRLVRVCPKCDSVYRWINGGMMTCEREGCGTSFM